MPVLILAIAKNLHELFQYGGLTSNAPLSESCRVMIMAIHPTFVLVVAILRSKDCRTNRTSKMFDVVLAIEGGDVGSAESTAAGIAEESEAAEVVSFAQWVLIWRLLRNREELRGNNFSAILINRV